MVVNSFFRRGWNTSFSSFSMKLVFSFQSCALVFSFGVPDTGGAADRRISDGRFQFFQVGLEN